MSRSTSDAKLHTKSGKGGKSKRAPLIAGVVAVLVLIAAFVVYHTLAGSQPVQQGLNGSQTWFTDDDGKTTFADDDKKLAPFDHNGKQAVRAYCFTTDRGKTHWVGYLERYTPAGKRAVEAYRAKKIEDQDPVDLGHLQMSASEVKPPGAPESEWTPKTATKRYLAITTPKPPAGMSTGGIIDPYLP